MSAVRFEGGIASWVRKAGMQRQLMLVLPAGVDVHFLPGKRVSGLMDGKRMAANASGGLSVGHERQRHW